MFHESDVPVSSVHIIWPPELSVNRL